MLSPAFDPALVAGDKVDIGEEGELWFIRGAGRRGSKEEGRARGNWEGMEKKKI